MTKPRESSKNKAMSRHANFWSARTRPSVPIATKTLTSDDIYCHCGRILADHQDPVITDQIQRHAKQQFELLATAAFMMIKGKTGGRHCEPSDEQQERGKATEALRNFKRERTRSYSGQMDDIRRKQSIPLEKWLDKHKSSVWMNYLWKTTVIMPRGKKVNGTTKCGL